MFAAAAIDGTAVPTIGTTVSFVIAAVGPHIVAYHATDLAGNVEADHTLSFTIVHELTTSLVAGGVSRTVTTDANGIATATLGLSPGAYTLTMTYAGSALYTASSATPRQVVVYLLTQFVVWGPNASAGARVQFWGDDWAKQIADKTARNALDDFKGHAGAVFDRYWTARPGVEVKPPRTVPQYIGVMLTTSANKTRDVITGDIAGVAILRVDLESAEDARDRHERRIYDGRLGERGIGTVLGKLAP